MPSAEVQGCVAMGTRQDAEKCKAGDPAALLACSVSAKLAGSVVRERPAPTPPAVRKEFREAVVSERVTCLSARGSGSLPPAGMHVTEGSETHPLPGGSCARETPRTSQISAGCKPRGHPHTAEETGEGQKGQLGTGPCSGRLY